MGDRAEDKQQRTAKGMGRNGTPVAAVMVHARPGHPKVQQCLTYTKD